MSEAPTIYGKHGEFRMPQDIWETAEHIVEAIDEISEAGDLGFIDLTEMLKTIIASALFAERCGMMAPHQ